MALTTNLTEEERGRRLLGALLGRATSVILMLERRAQPSTFSNLDQLLTKNFGTEVTRAQLQRNFETLEQKEGQSLLEFAREVERVGREHLLHATEEDLQEQLIAQFSKGLADPEQTARVAYAQCATLQETLSLLARAESRQKGKPPTKRVRLTQVTETEPGTSQQQASATPPLWQTQWIEMQKALQQSSY